MADSGSDMTPGPGMTAGSKMPWAKIAAVVIILIVIVAGFAAWRLASPTAPQSTPTNLAPSIGSVTRYWCWTDCSGTQTPAMAPTSRAHCPAQLTMMSQPTTP